jgi:cyclopropane-fatty-acyl-phospholipid synthase
MWRSVFDRLLRGLIVEGRLDLTLPDGTTRRYGTGPDAPLKVTIHDPRLIRRLVLSPDLNLGEGYMDARLTVAGDDIAGLLALLGRNLQAGYGGIWRFPLTGLQRRLRNLTERIPRQRAKANVAHHYDLSGALYALFLDADRQYSCAYFRSPQDTLDQAQAQKKTHIARKLMLAPGMRVLDIGCGWGGMALTLARDHGARVLGVTLSEEQLRVASARAAEAGLADRVEFRLMDYREVTGRFDRIVSVGMFEHVGVPHYPEYFGKVAQLLAPDGVALIHTIGRLGPPGVTSPWITRYIFPGGYVPALSEVLPAVERSGLIATDIEIWRLHYAETLRHWRARFEANLDAARTLYDDRFCRMWRYYLAASESGFRFGGQCVFQIQLSRQLDTVPLTRDYLYPGAGPADRPAERPRTAGGPLRRPEPVTRPEE